MHLNCIQAERPIKNCLHLFQWVLTAMALAKNGWIKIVSKLRVRGSSCCHRLSIECNQSTEIIFFIWRTKCFELRILPSFTFRSRLRWRFEYRLSIDIGKPIVACYWGVIKLTTSIFCNSTAHRYAAVLHQLCEMTNVIAANSTALVFVQIGQKWIRSYILSGSWSISARVVSVFSSYHRAINFWMAVVSL